MDTIMSLPVWAQWLFVGLAGLLVGSFLNVVIVRLPPLLMHRWAVLQNAELGAQSAAPPGLVWERSHCPHCKTIIAWYDNLPVLSWLVLKGQCRHCQKPIGWRYPIIEILTAALSVVVVWHFGLTSHALAGLVMTWLLIAASAIDLEHQLLPDALTRSLLWSGLLGNAAFGWFATPADAIIGAAAGYGFLWVIFQGFYLLTGKEGLGFGDLKLLAGLGAWLGWSMLPFVVFTASVLGTLVGLSLMVILKRGRDVPIAFGPYLAIAGWMGLIWQTEVIQWLQFY